MEVEMKKCPFCGGEELVKGYQSGDASIAPANLTRRGSAIESTVCMSCGSILHQRVLNPERLVKGKGFWETLKG